MSKNRNTLISVLIVVSIVIFILSFYIDWIDNHYSKILNVQFIILLIGIGISNMNKSKK